MMMMMKLHSYHCTISLFWSKYSVRQLYTYHVHCSILCFKYITWQGYCTTVPFLLFLRKTPPYPPKKNKRGLFLLHKGLMKLTYMPPGCRNIHLNSKFSGGISPRPPLVGGAFGIHCPLTSNIFQHRWKECLQHALPELTKRNIYSSNPG